MTDLEAQVAGALPCSDGTVKRMFCGNGSIHHYNCPAHYRPAVLALMQEAQSAPTIPWCLKVALEKLKGASPEHNQPERRQHQENLWREAIDRTAALLQSRLAAPTVAMFMLAEARNAALTEAAAICAHIATGRDIFPDDPRCAEEICAERILALKSQPSQRETARQAVIEAAQAYTIAPDGDVCREALCNLHTAVRALQALDGYAEAAISS